jgi:hypothetical protein
MTEQEILDAITNAGWTIVDTKVDSTAFNRQVITNACTQVINDAVVDKYFRYVKYPDETCYWWEKDPFVVKPTTFSQEVQVKITQLIGTNFMAAGYIEKIDNTNEKAIVVAIKDNSGLEYQTYHIYKDNQENLQATPITGSYPIGGSSI